MHFRYLTIVIPLGWQQALIEYSSKIRDIMGKMFAVLHTVRPENRNAVNDYLLTVYEPVTTLIDSINYCPPNDALRARFRSYIDSEEERLRKNLDEVDYDIDATDTLALVTGPGRIERVSPSTAKANVHLRPLHSLLCHSYTCF
jgi:hypothetical protein